MKAEQSFDLGFVFDIEAKWSLFIPQILKIEAERTLFIPQIWKIEAKRNLFILQIWKIEAERTRLPEIGKMEAKKMNWIEVRLRSSCYGAEESIPSNQFH
jgi:hypothetical protein